MGSLPLAPPGKPIGIHRTFQLCLFGISGWGIDLDYYDVEWFALQTNWENSVIFVIGPKCCISDSFVGYEDYSISPKGFLPTVVDIMVFWIIFAFPAHLSSLIHKMLMFTLAISCLTTSSLSWLWPDIPGSCTILLFTVWDFTFTTRHPQLGVISTLAQSLHSFWSYFSALLQQHIGHLPIQGAHLSVSSLFAFSYCSWGSQGKNAEVVCHLLQWTSFCHISLP